jgi:hypothetical protein
MSDSNVALFILIVLGVVFALSIVNEARKTRRREGGWTPPSTPEILAQARGIDAALPPLGFTPPDKCGKRFEGTVADIDRRNRDLLAYASIYAVVTAGFIYAMVFHTPQGFVDICLSLALGAFLGWIPLAIFAAYMQNKAFKENPAIVEMHDDGLWLTQESLFVPYERLLAAKVVPIKSGKSNIPVRRVAFDVLLDEGDEHRLEGIKHRLEMGGHITLGVNHILTITLPFNDSALAPSHDEIAQKAAALATIRNTARNVKPPEVNIFPQNAAAGYAQ